MEKQKKKGGTEDETEVSLHERVIDFASGTNPLDKEDSMDRSGGLDNLIKGRLPSDAGPSPPCLTPRPFCHP